MALQAQTPDLSRIQALVERLTPDHRAAAKPQTAREVISCIMETDFNANLSNPAAWDSTFRYINRVDEENGYRVLTQESYFFEEGLGFDLETRTLIYGVDDQGSFEGGFDSVVQLVPENGELIEFVKVYPFYNAANQPERLDIYFNTAAFGLPLGLILFGQNYFYYDANGYTIATSSKAVDFATFSLINADTSFFVNNAAGQPLEQTDWSWDNDAMAYEPNYRYTYTYLSVGGDLESEVIEQGDQGAWIFISRNLYFYNKPGQVSRQEIQIGEPGNWTTVQEIAYTYDAEDRVTEELESVVEANGERIPNLRTLRAYDTPEGWLELVTGQRFEMGAWVNVSLAIFEDCSGITSLDEVAADPTVKAWFNGARQLEFQVSEGETARLVEVFDLTGRPVLVATPAANAQALDAARLQQGLYLVRVTLADGRMTTLKAMQW